MPELLLQRRKMRYVFLKTEATNKNPIPRSRPPAEEMDCQISPINAEKFFAV
jgi:hypothetical protein